jgi:hypothetical protein
MTQQEQWCVPMLIMVPQIRGASYLEIPGPVAATGKNTQPNWTATGKDWTSSCSCLNSKPVQLQLSHFEESGQPMKNQLQPVATGYLVDIMCVYLQCSKQA